MTVIVSSTVLVRLRNLLLTIVYFMCCQNLLGIIRLLLHVSSLLASIRSWRTYCSDPKQREGNCQQHCAGGIVDLAGYYNLCYSLPTCEGNNKVSAACNFFARSHSFIDHCTNLWMSVSPAQGYDYTSDKSEDTRQLNLRAPFLPLNCLPFSSYFQPISALRRT